jgi:Ca2+-binding EF-hand superfamily protein
LEEYSETFRLFDKDGSNGLIREEFKAALQAEGTFIESEKFEDLFLKLSEGTEEIKFEQVNITLNNSLSNMLEASKKTKLMLKI